MAGRAAALDHRRAVRRAVSDTHRLAIRHDQELPCEPSHLRPFSRARAARSYGATLLLTETILRQNAQPTPALTSPARRRPLVSASDQYPWPPRPGGSLRDARPTPGALAWSCSKARMRARRRASRLRASPVPRAAAPAP